MPESVKPEPCPFCGEQATVAYTKEDGIYVHCQFCGAEGPKTGNSEADAISAWHYTNARPPQDAKPVAFKPLEWAELGDGVLTCIEWDFRLTEHNGKWGISPLDWPAFDHPYENLGAAKEAAQAAHEKNILSAFVSPPASPPLAIEALREALKPFAEAAERWNDIPGTYHCDDNVELWQDPSWRTKITVGDLRKARDLLNSLGDSDGR